MLRAIREDEDAARALGKNAFAYKLQSLAIAAALGAIAGYFLALNLTIVHPHDFQPIVHLLGLRGADPRRPRQLLGRRRSARDPLMVLEGTRFVDLPLSARPGSRRCASSSSGSS